LLEARISQYLQTCLENAAFGPGTKVLDAPTGYGRHAHWLARQGYRVVAVDWDAERVNAARLATVGKPQEVVWKVADLQEPSAVFDGSFDLMVCVHYFADSIVNRALEALKPGGLFLLETFEGHGENWRGLPPNGWASGALAERFELLSLREIPTGPSKSNVSLRVLARKAVQ
jgi:2-polyprenyl-3-methyl-5-hydroxy-6-metoxy-1,4-benzoquinol methylase